MKLKKAAQSRNPYHYQKLRDAQERFDPKKIAKAVGLSQVYVYKILAGERWYEPSVFAVADYLGVPRQELVKRGR